MAQVPVILSRRLSTTAARNALVKAPAQVFGIEGRYATAVYSAASKEKQLESVENDFKQIHAVIAKKGGFADFLRNPSLKRTDKKNLMSTILGGTKASKLTTNLLTLLAENGRLNRLDGITNAFSTIMSAHRGEIQCEVITAKPLDKALQTELEAALKSFVKAGQSVQIKTSVDPTLLGGMVVSIGDKYVDMSTSSKIKKYTELIETAI